MSGYMEHSIVQQDRLDDGVRLVGMPSRREQVVQKVAEAIGTAGQGIEEAGIVAPSCAKRDA